MDVTSRITITSSGFGGISLDDMIFSLRNFLRDSEMNVAAVTLRSRVPVMSLLFGDEMLYHV